MAATETVVGVFAHVDTTVRALEALHAEGLRDLTVYTPLPVHEVEDVLERGRPVSRVRLFTLLCGLTGTTAGFFLTIWSALQWGLITGGKPVASIPPFVVIAFELTILFGGVGTLVGLLVLAGLPRWRRSPWYDARFSVDRFGVAVHCPAGRAAAAGELLRRTGAEEVRG